MWFLFLCRRVRRYNRPEHPTGEIKASSHSPSLLFLHPDFFFLSRLFGYFIFLCCWWKIIKNNSDTSDYCPSWNRWATSVWIDLTFGLFVFWGLADIDADTQTCNYVILIQPFWWMTFLLWRKCSEARLVRVRGETVERHTQTVLSNTSIDWQSVLDPREEICFLLTAIHIYHFY